MKSSCPSCGKRFKQPRPKQRHPFGRVTLLCPHCDKPLSLVRTPLGSFVAWYGAFFFTIVFLGVYTLLFPALEPYHHLIKIGASVPLFAAASVQIYRQWKYGVRYALAKHVA